MTDKTPEIDQLDDQDLESVSAGGAALRLAGESDSFPLAGETDSFPVRAELDLFAQEIRPKLTGLAPRRNF